VIRPRPDRPVARGLTEATLQVGRDDVVLTDRGREMWLPGPAKGGVSRVILEPQIIRLVDRAGYVYLYLETPLWAPTAESRQQLHDELCDAGLDVLLSPVSPDQRPGQVAALLSAPVAPSILLRDAERGDPTRTTPWLTFVVLSVAFGTSIGALSWNAVVGGVLLAVSGTLLAMRVIETLRTTRADWRARQRVAVRTAEVVS
jgi:hypothetical protein